MTELQSKPGYCYESERREQVNLLQPIDVATMRTGQYKANYKIVK